MEQLLTAIKKLMYHMLNLDTGLANTRTLTVTIFSRTVLQI